MDNKIIMISVSTEELKSIIEQAVSSAVESITNKTPDPSELMTRKEAANYLGVCLPTLHEYSKKGIIPTYYIGTRVRYKRSELKAAMQKRQNKQYVG